MRKTEIRQYSIYILIVIDMPYRIRYKLKYLMMYATFFNKPNRQKNY